MSFEGIRRCRQEFGFLLCFFLLHCHQFPGNRSRLSPQFELALLSPSSVLLIAASDHRSRRHHHLNSFPGYFHRHLPLFYSLMENGDELGANEAQIPQKGISPDKISFGKWRLFLPHILPHFLFLSFLHLGNELFLRLVMLLQCGVGRVASPHSAVRSRVNESIERR